MVLMKSGQGGGSECMINVLAWLKTYYPQEFIACCLTFGSKTNFKSFIVESKRLGLTLKYPKVGKADATNWIVDKNGNLFAPFVSINGIGEKVSDRNYSYGIHHLAYEGRSVVSEP